MAPGATVAPRAAHRRPIVPKSWPVRQRSSDRVWNLVRNMDAPWLELDGAILSGGPARRSGWRYGWWMPDDDALCFRSATRLAAMIRDREASSVEIVEACLARIADVNSRINAVVAFADDALVRARAADAALARGADPGPLHGVPFTIKDSLDTAGVVTTAGTAGWRTRVPERDATVVARLKAAGGILLGKTNTPEFTWSNETDNDVYGITRNPYDLERTPGGSSGGPGAAVAAGCAPFDIGSDTGNSIRQPAHVCGIAGIKPTSGRVPRTGHWPGFTGLLENLTQLGPMARRVEDLALLLPLIAGPDGEDPHVAPVPLGDPAAVAVDGLRVVMFTDNGIMTPTLETIAAVDVGRPCPRSRRGHRRGRRSAGHRRRRRCLGSPDPRRRLRVAAAPHHCSGHRGAWARTTRAAGSSPSRRFPATC